PASVVEWSKSPRLVLNPGPAPWADVDPVAEAIRSPSHDDAARPPAWAVTGNVAPVAVRVEIFIASHFARNVVGGVRLIFAFVALESPTIEIVSVGKLLQIVIQVIVVAGESRRLVSDH